MKLKESIIYSFSIPNNKKFEVGKSIKEIAAYLLGVLTIESRYIKYNQIGEGYWIEKFEEFITNYLNAELNNFNDEWNETIGTSYSKWIYQNQKSDEDGLEKFYKILDLFILSVKEEK
jgi:hypothetical protein